MQQDGTTRTPQGSISAALAAANAAQATLASPVRFPGEDGGRSLAQMAQSDLDAALQLLADRAQFITGANGAAIALRRSGKNDMLCRASAGSNVPELGALLSAEFGLSGESVRTRQPLRCDDTERDPRVNREGCRELGIASVVVMPVVNDDEVLGVFELFSGKVNAFGERDLSALQRLSEMVETAVKLARAAESVPEQVMTAEAPVAEASAVDTLAEPARDEQLLDDNILDDEILVDEIPVEEVLQAQDSVPEVRAEAATEAPAVVVAAAPAELPAAEQQEEPVALAALNGAVEAAVPSALPKKPLFWSAASSQVADVENPAEPDQSHVPPVLRNLRTCEACGFPVSVGRALCVECEEKKWRGQLRRPSSIGQPAVSQKAVRPVPAVAPSAPAATPAVRAFAAAAQSVAAVVPVTVGQGASASVAPAALPAVRATESKAAAQWPVAAVTSEAPMRETATERADIPSPAFVLSAGMAPSQSWLSANKYILGALVLVAAAVAAIVLLH